MPWSRGTLPLSHSWKILAEGLFGVSLGSDEPMCEWTQRAPQELQQPLSSFNTTRHMIQWKIIRLFLNKTVHEGLLRADKMSLSSTVAHCVKKVIQRHVTAASGYTKFFLKLLNIRRTLSNNSYDKLFNYLWILVLFAFSPGTFQFV